ncbi:MAG: right-handed parallel beta-helix repeat-containing protein [Acidobacteria bacterium]|nr:right-handed parallel beta-helix repeat-containing protein [Acidobacteriota bacterium]
MRSKRVLAVALSVAALGACLIVAFAQMTRPRRATDAGVRGEIVVRAGGDLQRALDSARAGETLVLEAGATFKGTFTLPKKEGDEFITVRSSRAGELREGARVSPADAPLMPKLLAPGRGAAALQTAPGAHHWRLVGLEIAQPDAATVVFDLVKLGDGSSAQDTLAKVPHHITVDRCYVHAADAGEAKRGVSLQSADTEITNSYVAGFKVKGQEAQAVAGWNGPGPYNIINNYLEGAGENVIFGGAAASVPGLVPTGIEILRNHLDKPVAWRGVYTVKNSLELKNARRVRIEGNLIEHCWLDAQQGYAILFTPRPNDSGAWAEVSDVTFTNNVVRHVAAAFDISGEDSLFTSNPRERRLHRVKVSNNLFEDVDLTAWGGDGCFLKLLSGADSVAFEHNTILSRGWALVKLDGDPSTGFVFRDNVARHNDYGVTGNSVGYGARALETYAPGAVFTGNVIAREFNAPWNTEQVYPPGNKFPASLKEVLAGVDAGDYRVKPNSKYKRSASDGRDAGCDFDQLEAATKS